MEKQSEVILHLEGELNGSPISPTNYDIKDLRQLLDDIENMLNSDKKRGRPVISYRVEEGSVKHIFSTSKQKVAEFSAVLSLIITQGNLSGLELSTSKAIESIQATAKARNFSFDISTSFDDKVKLNISPETNYRIEDEVWADGEFYMYGLLTDAGGKNNSNIHLDVDGQTLVISTNKDLLAALEVNPLYKSYGVRVRGRHKIDTGEIDKKSLTLIELINYSPRYNEKYLEDLIEKAAPSFKGIGDADEWVHKIRGGII